MAVSSSLLVQLIDCRRPRSSTTASGNFLDARATRADPPRRRATKANGGSRLPGPGHAVAALGPARTIHRKNTILQHTATIV